MPKCNERRLQNLDEADHADKVIWLANELGGLPQGVRPSLEVLISYVTDFLRWTAKRRTPYTRVRLRLEEGFGIQSSPTPSPWSSPEMLSASSPASSPASSDEAKDTVPDGNSFQDLAALARQLSAAYLNTDKCEEFRDWDEEPACFHTATARMLDILQQNSYGEIRAKVMLTIGTVFPPELAESIVEYALIAEGLPTNPSAYKSRDILDDHRLERRCQVMHDIARWRRSAG